ncbi:MAG TPA: histidinol phosphate phosphatase domain-containing protein [Firmicutes bacterium]|jgi:putative hydrolase|nr:histidinol phosphate phosphatase domain-containing protein [Bacillota bacterium]HOQ24655.1 histidinol phosphate phosphatase domain-containing protein [Bacillota bacterium]HPT68173.1 histidinol phosphate phosphatase domain-containing protein [Bacillota bacterium]
MEAVVFDFHTHSFLSDGKLSPVELIRRALVRGYRGIAITDHVSAANLERVIKEAKADCRLAEEYWGIKAVAGVELTHVPAKSVGQLAARAKELGAELVVVHGETPVEPVEPGTNRAALTCGHIDILAHPGFLTLEEAEIAKENKVFIEISARHGHSFTNGHVAQIGRQAGVNFLVNSDGHAPGDLLTRAWAEKVALGAGFTPEEVRVILEVNPGLLLERVVQRRR